MVCQKAKLSGPPQRKSSVLGRPHRGSQAVSKSGRITHYSTRRDDVCLVLNLARFTFRQCNELCSSPTATSFCPILIPHREIIGSIPEAPQLSARPQAAPLARDRVIGTECLFSGHTDKTTLLLMFRTLLRQENLSVVPSLGGQALAGRVWARLSVQWVWPKVTSPSSHHRYISTLFKELWDRREGGKGGVCSNAVKVLWLPPPLPSCNQHQPSFHHGCWEGKETDPCCLIRSYNHLQERNKKKPLPGPHLLPLPAVLQVLCVDLYPQLRGGEEARRLVERDRFGNCSSHGPDN